jgi:head-tail adaptor
MPWVLIALSLALWGVGWAKADDSPAVPTGNEPKAADTTAGPPIYLFLSSPADLAVLVQRLAEPDFVLLRGAEARKLLDAAKAAAAKATEPAWSGIDTFVAKGAVMDDLARLTIELGISVADEKPVAVPIRLNGLTVVAANEAGCELPVRDSEGGWQVELAGKGRHLVRIEVLVPVRPTAEGRRIEMEIPEAATTQIELDVRPKVADAVAGLKDRVAVEPIEGGQRSRLSAHLAPRNRLELAWRFASGPGPSLPPLLAARGEIALEVNSGAVVTRSSWDISAARGTARDLSLRLDPSEEVLDLELDGQPLLAEVRRDGPLARLAVPLSEPLRSGTSRRLRLMTRRPLPAGSGARWSFHGFPIEQAMAQSGAIAVAREGTLWVDGATGAGVRRIDLRDLPSELRARPGNVLAYQFVDQPFELSLRVEPAPALVGVSARSTLTIDVGRARLDTWLDYEVARGHVFEVTVGLPRGLDLDSVGPEEVVAAYQWSPETTGPASPELTDAPRVLTIRLTPKAHDGTVFRIHLTGRQGFEPSATVPLALFSPRGASVEEGRIAVVTVRNVTAELVDAAGFRSVGLEPPEDWPWPAQRPEGLAHAFWLRYQGNPTTLPMRVAVRPRTVHHETTVTAQIDRRRLDVQQETVCYVHHGTLTRVDLAVPPSLVGLWELEGGAVASREPIRVESDGWHRYRLTLSREITETVRLRFRYRLPLEPPLTPERPRTVEVPWLAVLDGTSTGLVVKLAADLGIGLAPQEGGWIRAAMDEGGVGPLDGGPPLRFTLVRSEPGAGPIRIVATARALVELPALVASKLWLRTTRGLDGELRNVAWFRLENHEGAVSLALPPGARLIRARVGSDPIAEVEQLRGSGYRLRFPPGTPAGPVLLGLDYTVPARSAGAQASWSAPRLLDGGLVQETLWEIRVPWNMMVVGVPVGWTEENQWYWAGYVWKRRPPRDEAALAAWVAGSVGHSTILEGQADEGWSGYHGYLFGAEGDPPAARPRLVARAVLVGLCSASVLGLGLLVLLLWPTAWVHVATLLALAVAVSWTWEPSLTLLILQSSVVGVALLILAVVVERHLERRRLRHVFTEPGGVVVSPGTGSSLLGAGTVGSDDSTVVRVRPGSTVDHATNPPQAGAAVATAEHAGGE